MLHLWLALIYLIKVSLMTQLGSPAPFSPTGIVAYRNSALRTLSNLVMDTAVRRRRNCNRGIDAMALEQVCFKIPNWP